MMDKMIKEERKHEDGWWEKKQILCPCCNTLLEIEIDIRLTQVNIKQNKPEIATSQIPIPEKPSKFTDNEQAVLDYANKYDLLEIFEKVVKLTNTETTPKDMEKFFLSTLKSAAKKTIPAFALKRFADEFGGNIEFYSSQRIGIVLSGGIIRAFIPTQIVGGAKVRGIMGGSKRVTLRAEEDTFDGFIKTRYGLVSQVGAMFEMMKNKSLGGFCLPNFKKWRDK